LQILERVSGNTGVVAMRQSFGREPGDAIEKAENGHERQQARQHGIIRFGDPLQRSVAQATIRMMC
jgi:hypothetical protein